MTARTFTESSIDSRAGLAVYYRPQPRDIEKLCRDSGTPARIDVTAMDRIQQATDGYAPLNLPTAFTVVGADEDKPSVKRRISEHQARLPNLAKQILTQRTPAARLVGRRVQLYRGFLALSGILAAMLLVFASGFQPGIAFLGSLSETLRPGLGWVGLLPDPAVDLAFLFVGSLLPGFLDRALAGLRSIPELTTVIVLLYVLAFALRTRWRGQLRNLGLDTWRKAFAAAPAGGLPSNASVPTEPQG